MKIKILDCGEYCKSDGLFAKRTFGFPANVSWRDVGVGYFRARLLREYAPINVTQVSHSVWPRFLLHWITWTELCIYLKWHMLGRASDIHKSSIAVSFWVQFQSYLETETNIILSLSIEKEIVFS